MIQINKFNKIIVGNWKLNGSFEFIDAYFKKLSTNIGSKNDVCSIICPPNIYLNYSSGKVKNSFLGAQDCSKYNNGAYTGEISVSMIKENNCNFCIIGHSERRQFFNETSLDIKIKAENLIKNKINPIICIGETLEEKNRGITEIVLKKQIVDSLPSNSLNESLIIAYEPIWAIGTGLIPSFDEINKVHSYIKSQISNFENYKILYGGSVNSSNSNDIINLAYVDGVLVGGASIDVNEFNKILNI